MALSKRAQAALNVLEQEGASSSALASIAQSLGGGSPEGDRDTPGRRQSSEITKQGRDAQESRPDRASGDGPPKAPPFGGGSNQPSATDSNSPKSKAKDLFMRRRRGTAQKG